jgi:hypothetical protein
MSYDLKSERAKQPTLPGFVAWLERKDPNEHYRWPNSEICACGQYAKTLGMKTWQGSGSNSSTWTQLNSLARGDTPPFEEAEPSEWTFGQCLDRAKKVLAKA